MNFDTPPLKNPIVPCLWFDQEAEEAVNFYSDVFGDMTVGTITRYGKEGAEQRKKPEGTVLSVSFTLHGQEFLALNGGSMYQHSPGISFYVTCETMAEADAVWKALAAGGSVLMPYDQYPWSEKYGWLNDRFGLSWQISLGKLSDVKQKFVPSLMFVGEKFGKAAPAIDYYLEVFQPAALEGIARYEEQDPDETGKIKHAQFYLGGNTFMIMESSLAHAFDISPAVSFMIICEEQEEIDYFWDRLTRGDGGAVQCGWLYDQFGVSWQVVPRMLSEGMKDPEKAGKLMAAFMPMKKLDIPTLERAISD
ncbi:Glyoxalase superfamily enzyme, possibly 3-demethylubiquinone-9 3-methyltransferase [Cyclobacterium lianum]|uniref:Glyoxalase superfamily enzyme, possibly 3-demethylubiquinone-9 3-methyltransferase n=1 Tax=Cyclobacterium lianum TaxID=388280 RepID=A0A1M7I3C9_9BACT|nr:VOC family protein [Cyclobacterium lianum]SHM35168.1 Glyoxalase superfamily enzyme, possibly 3-demethylubiquinone-9 3-methyltransferase [Cyclobacterium lianum]